MTKLVKDVGNLLLLIVLNVIPIVNFIVLGYYVRVVRNDPEEPPKLSDYGALFVEGLKLVLALLIYAIIPLLILIVGGGLALLAAVIRGRWFAPVLFAASALAAAVFLLILFFALPALGVYMRTGDFSKAFAFGEAWALVRDFGLGNYVLLFILLAVFNLIAWAVGSLIPWVGHAIVGVFAMAFTFKAISLFVNIRHPAAPPALSVLAS